MSSIIAENCNRQIIRNIDYKLLLNINPIINIISSHPIINNEMNQRISRTMGRNINIEIENSYIKSL